MKRYLAIVEVNNHGQTFVRRFGPVVASRGLILSVIGGLLLCIICGYRSCRSNDHTSSLKPIADPQEYVLYKKMKTGFSEIKLRSSDK
ncbi:MAG TPA: hypothetical protein VIH42_03205 [Thermoguttaceae bacterium]